MPRSMTSKSGALQHHGHQVLADVVQVTLDRAQDDAGQRLNLLLGQQRLEQVQSGVHRSCGDQHLGHIDLVVLESLPDNAHPGNQSLVDDGRRVQSLGNRLFGQFLDLGSIADDQRLGQSLQIRHRSSLPNR